MVRNTEEGCAEVRLGTAPRFIFPCLKPQRPGNGRAAGAFRGCGAGDEGSRSGKAKLGGYFPQQRPLHFGGRGSVATAAPAWRKTSKLLPTGTGQQQQTGSDMRECYLLCCLSAPCPCQTLISSIYLAHPLYFVLSMVRVHSLIYTFMHA